MPSIEELGFELERRSILFHRDTTMPDNSQLGYVGDPNACINGATPGQTLLFNSPPGTRFLDKSKTPMERWIKVVTGPGALWVIENAPPEGISTGVFADVTATTNIGGGRVVIVYANLAEYADNINNYIGQLGVTVHAASSGQPLKVMLSGIITDSSWNFVEGAIYLGGNGVLTQTEPVAGASVLIGWAKSTTSFFIKPNIPIER